MFYRLKNANELLDWADYKYNDDCLETDLITQQEYTEHPNKIIIIDGELVLNPNYEQEEAEQREIEFKSEFFEVANFGFYRKQPKGYTSALESLTVAYNMVTSGAIEELPAGTFIFYPEPDYTKPEECTEEWLVAHQILSSAMTKEQFIQFYAAFIVAWNNEMH